MSAVLLLSQRKRVRPAQHLDPRAAERSRQQRSSQTHGSDHRSRTGHITQHIVLCFSLTDLQFLAETPGHYWKLHHVPLNAQKSFQVVFEARKGAGNSSGGFSLDDINISETECPLTWQIRDFEKKLNSGSSQLLSPLYYSSEGYHFVAELVVSRNQLYMYVALVSGAYDEQLQWPCPWRQITVQILDQNPHIQKRMSFEQSVTTDPDLTGYGEIFNAI